MLSNHTEKSHSEKWAEAERELAIRGVVVPTRPINHEHLLVKKDVHLPWIPATPEK